MSKINLTDRAIAQLVPPTQGRVEVLDARMPGQFEQESEEGRNAMAGSVPATG
jgi:3-mercaptopyruvate sulfurtransferase SseA